MPNSKEAGTEADRGDDVKLNSRDSVALKDLLQKRLSECGWRKDIEDMIRHTIEERGVSNLTHDQLAAEIVPHVGSRPGPRRHSEGDAYARARCPGLLLATGAELTGHPELRVLQSIHHSHTACRI
ncbi:enhancer of yellow 2b transcription factor isoform X1 [Drosophila biarmipes]|uniref:enhancer of yellow 2b transcription factor isoform X1 n=1 Tax=Drosophila biarmipes TaxID=125945 RepID=UPI0021CCD910|nr:enhancer of yellow 2b transcription factor isoform X1 [Drosophila biarmipes]